MTNESNIPASYHRGENELPFVPYQEGVTFQLLQVDINNSLWVIRVKFEPGVTIQRHRHTGDVLAFTTAGSWQYLEYPDVNVTGSYLYEPAGSIHTLHVPDTNTEVTDVWFAIRGANLDLADDDSVLSILDAGTILEIYRAQCAEMGVTSPNVIGA